MRVATIAVIVLGVAVAASCRDRKRAAPDEPEPTEHAIGAWPDPVLLEQVPLATDLAPNAVREIPGTAWAAASGQLAIGPALVVVDIDAAKVRWTDTKICAGEVVHATRERLVCASGQGVVALDVDRGGLAWRSPRAFRAAHDGRVLVDGALLDVDTGEVVKEVEPGPVTDRIRALCDDGAFAISSSGTFTRLNEALEPVWQVKLGRLPSDVHACRDPILVEVPRPGQAERALVAVARDSGAVLGEPVDVLGWWPAPGGGDGDGDGDGGGGGDGGAGGGGGGVVTATEAGIQRRAADLSAPEEIVSVQVAGRLAASRGDVRLVRAVAGSLLLMDGDGLRAWLAAPRGPRRAVLGERNLLAAGWVGPLDPAHRLTLWRLPRDARTVWPSRPLRPPDPAVVTAKPAQVPEAVDVDVDSAVVADGKGAAGVSAVVVRGTRVAVAHMAARPGPGRGAAVSAFDLRARAWLWHQDAGCEAGESVAELVETDGQVVCATRRADGTATLVAVDLATGAPAWRARVPSLDRIAAGPRRVAVASGPHWRVFDAGGEVVDRGTAPDGDIARFAFAGGRFVVDRGGVLVADGDRPWRVRVRGLVVGVVAAGDSLLAYTAAGELFRIAPDTGTPDRVESWSPGWEVPAAGDLYVDFPAPAGGDGFVVRTQRFALTLPDPVHIAPQRAGKTAPLMLIDRVGSPRIIAVDSASGAIESVHHWPRRAAQRGVFSAVVDGEPVKGVVLAGPLAVVLL